MMTGAVCSRSDWALLDAAQAGWARRGGLMEDLDWRD
jgi:hypothetical protein